LIIVNFVNRTPDEKQTSNLVPDLMTALDLRQAYDLQTIYTKNRKLNLQKNLCKSYENLMKSL